MPAFVNVAAQPPESPERAAQPKRFLELPLVAKPIDGGAEIGLFALEQVEPSRLLAPREQLLRFLGQGEKVLRVTLRDSLVLRTRGQPFLSEVSNRLQHPYPRIVADELNQTLVNQ